MKTDKKPFDEDLPEYSNIYIPSLSPRIKAQNAVFTHFKNPTIPLSGQVKLEKFIIPARFKPTLKVQLLGAGVSYNTIFPDFDGISKYINWSVLNNKSE